MRGPPGSWAHPRSRGENSIVVGAARAAAGSSPLTRGKQTKLLQALDPDGLIPAHAGKTRRLVCLAVRARAHPRSRGENGGETVRIPYGWGSSPLTRGKPGFCPPRRPRERLIPAHAGTTTALISARPVSRAHPRSRGENPCSRSARASARWLIPAHAGKTIARARRASTRRAHPRSRGENVIVVRVLAALTGSSPLTRGKPVERDGGGRGVGLIPAHAGKTEDARRATKPARAHPRSRGENASDGVGLGWPGGSSPLTRGKLTVIVSLLIRMGLIPAHAGKTARTHTSPAPKRAHPRSRGENNFEINPGWQALGSSPLTRGKPNDTSTVAHNTRLIPAHAGKTHALVVSHRSPGAHPRSRGENHRMKSVAASLMGSSPLTRGKLLRRDNRRHVRGLIPAHAGKTGTVVVSQSIRRAHPRSRGENASMNRPLMSDQGSSPLTRGKQARGPVEADYAGAHPRSRGENSYIPGGDTGVKGSSPLTRGKLR